MDGSGKIRAVEWALDGAAAAILAIAILFAAAKLSNGGPVLGTAAGAIGFAAGFAALRRIDGEPSAFELAQFDLVSVDSADEPDELLLRLEDRIAREVEPSAVEEGVLLLDDILASLTPDSRVVRLFDPASMPTAGELRANIDRHLRSSPGVAPPDASEALHEALSELRRSLR